MQQLPLLPIGALAQAPTMTIFGHLLFDVTFEGQHPSAVTDILHLASSKKYPGDLTITGVQPVSSSMTPPPIFELADLTLPSSPYSLAGTPGTSVMDQQLLSKPSL